VIPAEQQARDREYPSKKIMVSLAKTLVAVLLFSILVLPSISSGFSTGTGQPDGGNITLNITLPREGDTFYLDVVPAQAPVTGFVNGSGNLEAILIRTGEGETDCGNQTPFTCEVPVLSGTNTITITAFDDQGHSVTEIRNLTIRIGLLPPAEITISGKVLDPGGNPVSDATVLAESVMTYYGKPLTVSTITAPDGSYVLRNAVLYTQTFTITKPGYAPFHQKVVFENLSNEHDFILQPDNNPLPGFGFIIALLAVAGIFVTTARKRSGR